MLAEMLCDLQKYFVNDDNIQSELGSEEIRYNDIFIRLHNGVPGKESGHEVYIPSYFDRFWERGGHEDRMFIVVKKVLRND